MSVDTYYIRISKINLLECKRKILKQPVLDGSVVATCTTERGRTTNENIQILIKRPVEKL